MPKIAEAVVYCLEIPLSRTYMNSRKKTTTSQAVLVHLRTDEKVSGWGEATLNPSFTHETPASTRESIARLAQEQLVGLEVEEAFVSLPEIGTSLARRIAGRCALSIALWDLYARVAGVPVYALLGGARRTSIPAVYPLGNFDASRDAEEAQQAVADGFEILKLKIGRADVGADLAAVESVRRAIGPEPRIFTDANQAWNRHQAVEFLGASAALGVALVEQPLPRWDRSGIAELSGRSGAMIASDESLSDAEDLLGALVGGYAPAAVVVKLLKTAGIEGALELLRLCDLANVSILPAGSLGETSIVSSAILHLALAARSLPLGAAITPQSTPHDVVVSPLAVINGRLQREALDGPGLGVTVDPERVLALSVGS